MGIIKSNVKVLLDAKKRGVDFTNTATLGHLKWYVTKKELENAASVYGIDISKIEPSLNSAEYSDIFFREMLGVKNLTTIDNSAYEGANISHDLNQPIPKNLEKAYDVVIDSGTLEHVFNFPSALSNVMKMVRVGGTLFITTPANNYMGHGFYQFSPELFFRVFQKENGFELINMLLIKHPYPGAELSSYQQLYEAIDPASIGQRASLVGNSPILLAIEARRVSDVPLFATYPQQSDYSKIWSDFDRTKGDTQTHKSAKGKNIKQTLKNILEKLPIGLQRFVWGQYQRFTYSIRNKKFFRKVKNL